jgi:hypothetical protein
LEAKMSNGSDGSIGRREFYKSQSTVWLFLCVAFLEMFLERLQTASAAWKVAIGALLIAALGLMLINVRRAAEGGAEKKR